MRAAAIALALIATGAGACLARAAPPTTATRVDREVVYVHEQVVLNASVTHALTARPRWEPPPFEGFWAERLPSIGRTLDAEPDGRRSRLTTFRRALFPSRSGSLEVPPSRVTYRDDEDREQTVEVPGVRIEVRELPATGRPEGFPDIVGDVEIDIYLTRQEVALGQSVRAVIDWYGNANLWDVPDTELDAALAPAAEVFAERARIGTGVRDGRLTVRRSLTFDVVPKELGEFEIPELRLAFFDPEQGRYRVARSEALPFRVLPRAELRPLSPFESRPTRVPVRLPWAAGLALVAAVGALVATALTRWWRAALRPMVGPPAPNPRLLWERARDAAGTPRFAALLADAVKAGIHVRHGFDARPLTTEELAARVDDRPGIELLRRLDRSRFAGGVDAPEALLKAVRSYLGLDAGRSSSGR